MGRISYPKTPIIMSAPVYHYYLSYGFSFTLQGRQWAAPPASCITTLKHVEHLSLILTSSYLSCCLFLSFKILFNIC